MLDYLERARKATMEEQDRYCEIIEKSLKLDANEGINQKILTGGWKAVLKVMQDCCYPPVHEERERFLNISWEQEPSRIKLEEISDKDIRYKAYFLNSTIEHTQRLRAMAMFVEGIGSLKGLGAILFRLWSHNSSLHIIYSEAVQMGKNAEAELIREWCSAIDKAADILLRE